jgi:hypothetical protein
VAVHRLERRGIPAALLRADRAVASDNADKLRDHWVRALRLRIAGGYFFQVAVGRSREDRPVNLKRHDFSSIRHPALTYCLEHDLISLKPELAEILTDILRVGSIMLVHRVADLEVLRAPAFLRSAKSVREGIEGYYGVVDDARQRSPRKCDHAHARYG